jgi:GNAT superfamily N-acetyltransferase
VYTADFERFARILARYRGGPARYGPGYAELPSARSQPSWLSEKLTGECLLLGPGGARAWLEERPRGAWAAHVFGATSVGVAGFERQWVNSLLEAPALGRARAAVAITRGFPEQVLLLSHGKRGSASLTIEGDVAYLADLYVKPEHRGRGLGRELIDSAVSAARDEGCSRVWAIPSARARALYERAGFLPLAPIATYLARAGSRDS